MRTILGGCVLTVVMMVGVGAQDPGTITLDFGNPMTLNFTQDDVDAMQLRLDALNARLRVGEDPWTIEDWLSSLMNVERDQSRAEARGREIENACNAYRGKDGAGQQAVKVLLEGNSPCMVSR